MSALHGDAHAIGIQVDLCPHPAASASLISLNRGGGTIIPFFVSARLSVALRRHILPFDVGSSGLTGPDCPRGSLATFSDTHPLPPLLSLFLSLSLPPSPHTSASSSRRQGQGEGLSFFAGGGGEEKREGGGVERPPLFAAAKGSSLPQEEMGSSSRGRQQLRAMLRKNWLLKTRHPFATAAELLLPTVVMLLLIGVRTRVDTQIHPVQAYIRKSMFVEVGKSETSPPFQRILELLVSRGEDLAFVPDTEETRTMLDVLSFRFPLLKVVTLHF
ncbi:hypothetical protein Taro_011705 [Colocasia esculenta]|uniref:Uncharacterized protein n=1 Tax=Colocasia esculenta TaxID=4460 RepID=A0A843UBL1_COLES|nr:hypothetical protein [Colocasia esculenta]